MEDTAHRAIAIVGAGAVLPDAPNVGAFWENVKNGRYSITEVPPERWDPCRYYDPDPRTPDKTYSKIGAWVRDFVWEPFKWHLAIPPRVIDAMEEAQKWAIAGTREALEDYGYPKRSLPDRTAVILGNAMAGEKHYLTSLRAYFPEYERELEESPSFAALPVDVRRKIVEEFHQRIGEHLPPITEDSMPGELANCIAGRIANIYNVHGPNFIVDAACASAMAAITAAAEGLIQNDFELAITGGIDRNMGPSTFIKFCKIGALSATGSRPYAEGADGFVMGEGAAIFLLKRLADAERDGDKIYAVLRGIGGSSDGKGKGITAPNPVGQKLAVQQAWRNAGLSPATASYFEGHGTSTKVGDVVEVQSLAEVLSSFSLPPRTVALGSVKSNIGHLKGAAGAAGFLKTALALREKVLPASVQCEHTNPEIDFSHSPLYVNKELTPWNVPADQPRRAGLSAFGFGGTNFHAVLEEYVPHKLTGNGKRSVAVGAIPESAVRERAMTKSEVTSSLPDESSFKAPLRGALVIGAESAAALIERLRVVQKQAEAGHAPPIAAPLQADLRAPERISIDYADAADLADKAGKALKACELNQPAVRKALRAQGIFRGHGPAPKVAFLYTGQGSQYVNMLEKIRAAEPIVAKAFEEANHVLTPLLGKPLTDYVFVDQADPVAVARAEEDLKQTEITQPAVLAIDLAMTRLLASYGIQPDMTMGHSLGEYGALVAAGALPFNEALEAVSARGRGMTQVQVEDKGKMAAVFAPLPEIEKLLKTVTGYVVIANINSDRQGVIGGASAAVQQAMEIFIKAGYETVELPVSHAFHTSIVSPASEPLRRILERMHLQSPQVPVVANVDGEFYPTEPDAAPKMVEILARQVAAPVQFVKGLHTLYDAGARVFVEVGPKKALQGFAEDVLGNCNDVLSLFTNHPKIGDIVSFNQALCGLYASGLGRGYVEAQRDASVQAVDAERPTTSPVPFTPSPTVPVNGERYAQLGHLFANVLERGWEIYHGKNAPAANIPVVITGAAIGLPGTEHIFSDDNVARILRGDQFIDSIPTRLRQAMLDKHITRLVKSDNGGPTFETITTVADVIKLAGRGGDFDLEDEFGVSDERVAALDTVTRLAIAVGIDALRDAGIPLVMRYKTTSKGTQLSDRWALPDDLRDSTGVIFASAFPGLDSFAEEISHYHEDRARREQISLLEDLRGRVASNGHSILVQEIDRRLQEVRIALEKDPYLFDRRFLFRVLSMGHSQFAEFIGARGPNTQINAACASTGQGIALAEDWINAGRCRRVIIVSSDNVTSDNLMEWIGAGFLASGAAATDEVLEDAAIPFDRRRHGLLVGMGAAGIVVESAEAARERGIRPICEVLSAVSANSAFHGTRLDVQHIGQVMEDMITRAETRCGISRREIAPKTVFVSHETYTPARGGSASAEIFALRKVFGDVADRIVIGNTKGYTGHAMATGIEEVVAIKALETGCVPPLPNFKEVDPELGPLNLSRGGMYPVEYALRLGAGFGSQISMALLRWVKTPDGLHPNANALGYSYRIADTATWNAWLTRTCGHPAELEVVRRTLRVRDRGLAVMKAETAQLNAVAAPVAPVAPSARVVGVARTPIVAVQVPLPAAKPIDVKPAAVSVKPAPVNAQPVAPVVDAIAAIAQPISAEKPQPAAPNDVKERVLALVSEKTGYPADMLDVDLDLEADLGVDTVKQAEVFATVREAYGITREDQVKLRDFPTLAHVIRFVYEKRPDLSGGQMPPVEIPHPSPEAGERVDPPELVENAGQPQEAAKMVGQPADIKSVPEPTKVTVPASLPATHGAADAVKDRILSLVVEKTGYPKDMLDIDLDLEADLGVDTVKQAEMFAAIREIYKIPRDEDRKLRDYPTLAHVIRFVYEKRPDLTGPQMAATRTTAAAAKPTSGESHPSPEVGESVGHPGRTGELRQVVETVHEAVEASVSAPQPAVAVVPAIDIKEKVLDIVAEKTGYPKDMLDLELDLEADLGIDTVKQAEMFASVRAAFNIPREENLKLREFPTLAHVIKFAEDRLAAAAATPKSFPTSLKPGETVDRSPGARPAQSAAAVPRQAPASFDAANRIPRRVPLPNLRPPLTMCKPTEVTLGRDSRVVLMPDTGGVGTALAQRLEKMGIEVLQLDPALNAAALAERLKQWTAAGPIQGVYWLPALDSERSISDMDAAIWREAIRVRLKSLYATMRALYEQIAAPGTFLVAGTRLGGQHGYDDAGALAPMGGAVSGFVKTYKRERLDVLAKIVDFESDRKPADIAETLIHETLRDPGAVEIGYKRSQRWTVGLQEQPAADGLPGLKLDRNTVFLITGAAGSIVSAITADLANASGGIFFLLDVVPEPAPNDLDLKRFTTDKEALKRDIFARIQARGERATPALVEKALALLERLQAAEMAIEAVRTAGGTAHYFSVNLLDAESVAKVIQQVRERSGRIDVLLHAAGMERSHLLPEKDQREFDLVFDVKSDGWFNLLHAIGPMPLGATVAFSSIAGRFGNAGQADYSSANDLLCKIASSFRTTRPGTRGIVIDWTAWGGIGMASRGSIPKMMELAGIDMLPLEAGVPLIRRELTTGGTRGEVVVAQRLGILMNEWDPNGGLDETAANAPKEKRARGPMVGDIKRMGLYSGLTIETTLDPAIQPFLHDHQIDGTPVLPGVMGIEAFAEAATQLCPGWRVEAVEEVNFLAPFKFYRNEPRTVSIEATIYPRHEALLADCRLIGRRQIPNQKDPQLTTHFTARVRLTQQTAERVVRPAPRAEGAIAESGDIYRVYFHGPAYQVVQRAWLDGNRITGQFAARLPNNHEPAQRPIIMVPRLIELCFQTAGLWELGVQGRFGLPHYVREVCLWSAPDEKSKLYAVVTADPQHGTFDAEVLDVTGVQYLRLTGYHTVAVPDAVDAEGLKALQHAMTLQPV